MHSNLAEWQSLVAQRAKQGISDPYIRAYSNALSILPFKTKIPSDPYWPEWRRPNPPENVVRLGRLYFQIRRALFGHVFILAAGRVMPGYGARLSDLLELKFGQYRLKGKPRFNYSEEQAKLDWQSEPELVKAIDNLHKAMLDREYLPIPSVLSELKNQKKKNPNHHRRSEAQIVAGSVKELESAASAAVMEIQIRLDKIEAYLKQNSNGNFDT